MAKIRIDTSGISDIKVSSITQKLDAIEKTIKNVWLKDVWKDLKMTSTPKELKQAADTVGNVSSGIKSLNKVLEEIASYETTENEIAEKAVRDINITVTVPAEDKSRMDELYAKIKNGTATQAEINEYCDLYEKQFTEEELKNINEFFNQFKKEDSKEIRVMLYTANDPVRTEYVEMLKSGTIKFAKTTEEVSNYLEYNNTLTFNMDNIDKDDPRGKYCCVWHELGHAHDDFSGSGDGIDECNWSDSYRDENGRTVNDVIKDDARNTIIDRLDNKYPGLSDGDKNEICKYMLNGEKTEISKKNKKKAEAMQKIIKTELYAIENSTASDCYSCITDYGIKPGCAYHDQDYTDSFAQAEAYADYMAFQIIGNTKAQDGYKKYMPGVDEIYSNKYKGRIS